MKGMDMPKQSPIPDDLDRPFYDAANQDRLVLQYCTVDDRWQYPPEAVCGGACGSADNLEWRENDGAGTIYSYAVVYDTPIAALQADQPFNCAVIELDHAPGINFLSHLPGQAPGDVPIGGKVKLTFEATQATGQKVPEWNVVK
jgi:uncharacterized OB-fold protein